MSYDPIAAMRNDMRPNFPEADGVAEQAIYRALGLMNREDARLLREHYGTIGSRYKSPQSASQIARRQTDTVRCIEGQLHIALMQLITRVQQTSPQ